MALVPPTTDDLVIQEIRDNYDYAKTYWSEIYKQGRLDMRVVAGDPWPRAERTRREGADRLCLSLDEVNQYLNQTINEVRQNKRAIAVTAKGNGANDDTALFRQGIIRGIEYESKATQTYIKGFENLIQRSFGYWKVLTDYEEKSHRQVLKLVPISNPEMVLPDPDAKDPWGEDMRFCFELDPMSERAFRSEWPKAKIQSFSSDIAAQAPAWFPADANGKRRVVVAAYWKCERNDKSLIDFGDNRPSRAATDDEEVADDGTVDVQGKRYPTRSERAVKVYQYITNGVEILKRNEWSGSSIPIITLFGKELFVSDNEEGGDTKRVLLSMVRLARDGALLYCFARTAQSEMAGMIPKMPLVGYEGQFTTNTDWGNINRKIVPYAEVKAKTVATGEAILPHPIWVQWAPPINEMETVAVAGRQAVQSAMGITGMISGRKGQNPDAKSGVALKELDSQESLGSFHFVDTLDGGIERTGRILDELLPKIYPEPREVQYVGKDGKASPLKINQPGTHPEDETQPIHFRVDQGDHGVTISTGPSQTSQRTQGNEFADQIAGNPQVFGAAIAGNKTAAKVVSLSIKLKNLGPIGDEMADAIDPDENGISPQIQAREQQAGETIDKLTQEVHALAKKAEDKQAELELKRYTVDEQEKTKRELGLGKIDAEDARAVLLQQLGVIHKKLDTLAASHQQASEQAHEHELAATTASLMPPPQTVNGSAADIPQ